MYAASLKCITNRNAKLAAKLFRTLALTARTVSSIVAVILFHMIHGTFVLAFAFLTSPRPISSQCPYPVWIQRPVVSLHYAFSFQHFYSCPLRNIPVSMVAVLAKCSYGRQFRTNSTLDLHT